jgi:pimeloyl-ACP methyl ester carboxylesterase
MIESAPGPTSHRFLSQRLRLHYVDWGSSDLEPLLMIHGGRDHCRNWDWVAHSLREKWHIIAPDLRGHGDSDWSPDGHYDMASYVYDLAQLIHQKGLAPVTILAHSLGGNIALRYAGLYPETVKSIVAIEGLGWPPKVLAERAKKTFDERLRDWIEEKRSFAGRLPRRYQSIEEALGRMQGENKHLSPEQAYHLTVHGTVQNEDGTYSWKFDNYVRNWPAYDMPTDELQALWAKIKCPTLLVYGEESWASSPEDDGRIKFFSNAKVQGFADAGHWVHHDQLQLFLDTLNKFWD